MLFSCSIWGQHEVKIEFRQREDSKITLPKKIKRGDFYKVRVCDINLNRYSVLIKNKDSTVSKALELPTFDNFSLDNLTKLTSNFSSSTPYATMNFDSLAKIDSIDSKKTEDLKELIENAITIAETKTKLHADGLVILKSLWDDLKFKVYRRRLNLLKEIPEDEGGYNYEEALNAVEALRGSSDALKNTVTEEQKKYKSIVENKKAMEFLEKKESVELKEKVTTTTKAFATLIAKIEELKTLITADNVEKLLKSILFLSTKSEYLSLPIQFKGELEELSISFVPKDSTSGLQTETLPSLIFPVENQWYWSVGTSFYYSNLSNERFSTTSSAVEDNTVYSYKQVESTSREAGISAMLRVGKKFWESPLGFHLGFGPGISIDNNVRPRLLFGGGLSLGRKHNLTIDYGGVLGYVDRFADGVSTSDSGLNTQPDPLKTEILIANYFSIGYMFKL